MPKQHLLLLRGAGAGAWGAGAVGPGGRGWWRMVGRRGRADLQTVTRPASMVSSSETSPEKEKRTRKGEMVMDSIKGIHYGVENDEIYLVVVVVDART